MKTATLAIIALMMCIVGCSNDNHDNPCQCFVPSTDINDYIVVHDDFGSSMNFQHLYFDEILVYRTILYWSFTIAPKNEFHHLELTYSYNLQQWNNDTQQIDNTVTQVSSLAYFGPFINNGYWVRLLFTRDHTGHVDPPTPSDLESSAVTIRCSEAENALLFDLETGLVETIDLGEGK